MMVLLAFNVGASMSEKKYPKGWIRRQLISKDMKENGRERKHQRTKCCVKDSKQHRRQNFKEKQMENRRENKNNTDKWG